VVVTLVVGSGGVSKTASAQMGMPLGYQYVPKIIPLRFNVPIIPGFGGAITDNIIVGANDPSGKPVYVLDGLSVKGNVFSNPAGVQYGGGAYKLEKAYIGGPVSLELIGAAANTAQLLQTFGLLSTKEPTPVTLSPPPLQKNSIIKKDTHVKPYKGDVLSTFDGT
jgi:hypothetical protein